MYTTQTVEKHPRHTRERNPSHIQYLSRDLIEMLSEYLNTRDMTFLFNMTLRRDLEDESRIPNRRIVYRDFFIRNRLRFPSNFQSVDNAALRHTLTITLSQATPILNMLVQDTHLKSLTIESGGTTTPTPQFAHQIANVLTTNHTLTTLNLKSIRIDTQATTQIAQALATNQTLQQLGLRFCMIPDEGATQIAHALRTNHTLQTLNLERNNIVGADRELLEALRVNTSLTLVNVSWNPLSADVRQALRAIPNKRIIL